MTLPSTLTKIGKNAFYECKALTEITLPDGVESIGDYAFSHCAALQTVKLPAKLKTIGSYAFYNSGSLTALELPDGLQIIGNYAFSGTKIERLELPDSVTQVDLSGLSGSLTYLRWTAGIPVVSRSRFTDFTKLQTVILPEGVTELADGTFQYATYGTFLGCTSLTSVTLPSTLTKIGKDAFAGTGNFTAVVWPGSPAETYMIQHGIDYIYHSDYNARGTLNVTLDPKLFTGMKLVLDCCGSTISRAITGESSYLFTGLQLDSVCTVQLVNAYGDVLAVYDNIAVTTDGTLEITAPENVGDLCLRLLDAQGADRAGTAQIGWYDGAGRPYGTGARLKSVPAGKALTIRIQLDDASAREYWNPAPITHTVTAGDDTIDVTLEPVSEAVLSGTVKDAHSPVAGASVVVSQTLNDKYTRQATAVTDKQGAFRMTVLAAPASITVHGAGYLSKTTELAELKGATPVSAN